VGIRHHEYEVSFAALSLNGFFVSHGRFRPLIRTDYARAAEPEVVLGSIRCSNSTELQA
jgi:hypothetical protein